MNIQGKTVLITGASRGIGRAIALELAKQKAKRLILVARNHHRLASVAAEVEVLGAEVVLLPLDLTQLVEIDITIARTWKDYGPIHLLVNCAGVAHQAPFLQSRFKDIQSEVETNLIGMYAITRLVARRMVTQRQGVIVNVSSLMGKVAAPTMATYSATKFAIVGFTKALRCELAVHNVKVLSLLPSLTDTDMVRDLNWFRWVAPITPEQVAKALVNGVKKESAEILVGWQTYLAVLCNRIAPSLMERVISMAAPLSPQSKYYLKLKEAKAET
ncbi:MAG: SDR family NAD(P)-dependent oxidoreductase [Calothrix sp. C42_A2020_038]|nr:SDR family NAD(P)-dependent oxidoreductase [Calothrix sp. C42_A2020_038]